MEAKGMNYPTNWLMKARRKYLQECERDYPQAKERKEEGNNQYIDKRPVQLIAQGNDDGPDEFSPDAIFGEN
jgi:hypothetical protein